MRTEVIEFNKTQRKDVIDFRAGDIVKVHRKIKEGEKERIQIFEGMIIAKKGGQSSSPMLTVRKVSNGVGIEIIVPIFSPTIEKIELVKRAKVRKSKLYYVRDKAAKALRFKFTDKSEIIKDVVEEEKTPIKEVETEPKEVVAETKKDSSEK
jgi:large subunit ribosomal protein L19